MATAVTKNPSITIPNVPCLKLSGSNWAIFSLQFQEAIVTIFSSPSLHHHYFQLIFDSLSLFPLYGLAKIPIND